MNNLIPALAGIQPIEKSLRSKTNPKSISNKCTGFPPARE
jgi:hypothetical protein